MYWFTRPPYWRWAAAAAIVAVAAFMDLSGPPTEPYPYAAQPVAAGEIVAIEWRDIPRGVLPPAAAPGGVAAVPIAPGTPLLAALLTEPRAAPDEWWAVAAQLPVTAVTGGEVLITLPGLEVGGIVIAPGGAAAFGETSDGLIAVPPEHAAAVAAGLNARTAIVLVRP